MKRKLIGIVVAILCILTLAQTAFAAEMPSLSIPVTIDLKGNVPSVPEKFSVVLKAKGNAPLPEGAEDGSYTMTILGEDTKNFPAITYSRVGIYEYSIYQLKGANKKCKYDGTVYDVTVYVTNKADGNGLELAVAIYANGEGNKLNAVTFTNKYEYEPSDTPQTSDESNFPLYAALAGGSILVLLALFLTRKREEF